MKNLISFFIRLIPTCDMVQDGCFSVISISKMPMGAGIFSLPINIPPEVLTFQLYTRQQWLIYSSPYLSNQ